ncbi:replication factor C subunit 4 [Lepeophtheirus salmonis]|uniref:replication factor C subunit 4 n=1 Tax=Lepeophtheirus salmonis TaxID=72036 RepID=UPI001AEA8C86|nr:replication factor C subunit 4-like [Lepeophtheirus salmonis]
MDAFLKTGKIGVSKDTSAPKASKVSKGPAPWVEKYRPKTVDDVAYQDEVILVLKKSLQGADLPNLLFYGPPGTGKTSTILAACRELFGDAYKDRILELNASDERGISVVRHKIKNFARLTAGGTLPNGKSCPPFKVIILDEADSMTKDAQSALRRTMEKEGKSTKFCLICNYVSRIIEPLTSRCAKFRFKPLEKSILAKRLKFIAEKEMLNIKDTKAIDAFIQTSEGDLRRAITSLQSCSRFSAGKPITEEIILETAGVIPDEWISLLKKACVSNSYEKIESFVDDLIAEGYSAYQLFIQIHEWVMSSEDHDFKDLGKAKIAEALAVNEHRLLEGSNEYLQIMDLCCVIMKEMNK